MTADPAPKSEIPAREHPLTAVERQEAEEKSPAPAPPKARIEPTRLGTIRESLPTELVARLLEQITVGSDPQTVSTYAPFSGEEIAKIPQSMPGDVRLAFERARAAQHSWAPRST